MMRRDVADKLERWKNSPRRKPMVVTGVRKCGKTRVITEFAECRFDDVAYVDLKADPVAAGVFEYDDDPARIVSELGVVSLGRSVVPGKTILVLDEVQCAPSVLASLRRFHEEMPELHVICAGTMLGMAAAHAGIAFPADKVNCLQMYPMSFPEFLAATGNENHLALLVGFPPDRPVPAALAASLEKSYLDYLVVGGMPEAVEKWVETHGFDSVDQVQTAILDAFRDDFSKFSTLSEAAKIGWVWDSVPQQLAKANNKFMYAHVKSGRRSFEIEKALEWLVASSMVRKTEMVCDVSLPLDLNAQESFFKAYLCDVGLLRKLCSVPYEALQNSDPMYALQRRALDENYVHNEMLSQGLKPFFWRSGNTAEVDFVFEKDGRVLPVDVKSAKNAKAKSYRLFCSKYDSLRGFRLSLSGASRENIDDCETLNLPLYMAWKLRELARIESPKGKHYLSRATADASR